MKGKRMTAIMAAIIAISLCACSIPAGGDNTNGSQTASEDTISAGDKTDIPVQKEAEETEETTVKETEEAIPEEPEDGSPDGQAAGQLPPYEYPGPEAFYTVLYKYMTDVLAEGYSESQVTIPCPFIIAEDESNKDDIRVWGDFWVFNYELNGRTLENTSGGSNPGCIHIRSIDEYPGYEVTEMERVGDGSDYDPTAKKIFGKYYEDFIKNNADTEGREAIRAQIIANYVAANDLDITEYKDYGWDPVKLPEENIDNFYSQLD